MNETKKTIVTLLFIFAVIMLLPLSLYVKNVNGRKKLDAIKEIYTTSVNSLIYIGSSNCSYCDQFDPIIDEVSENYNFKYAYIDRSDLTNSQLNELLEILEINQSDFGTPYLVTASMGEKTSEKVGFLPKTDFINFLKDSGFLTEEVDLKDLKKIDETADSLTFITSEEYIEIYEKNKKSIIVFGQTYCGACIQAKPVLNKIAKEKNITINYLEYDLIDAKDKEKVVDTLEKLGFEDLYTPHIMILESKKQVDKIIGSKSEEDYLKLFRTNGFID